MFENRQPIAYCSLKDGKVQVYKGKDKDGKKQYDTFDQLTAKVTAITEKTSEYNGQPIKSWQVALEDEKGEIAMLQLGYSSGFTRGFFNALANADLSRPIRISCYTKSTPEGDWDSPSIAQGPDLVRWKYEAAEIPKVKKEMYKGKEIYDDEAAMKWLKGVIEEIKANIPKSLTTKEVADVFTGDEVDDGIPSDLPF